MTELKKEEARSYSLGYAAGRRRLAKEDARAVLNDKWNAAFLASLAGCVNATNWKRAEEPIITIRDRVLLAKEFANEAMGHMK